LAGIERSLNVTDFAVIGYGNDGEAFPYGRVHNGFGRHSRVSYIMRGAIRMDVQITTVKACSIAKRLNLAEIQGDNPRLTSNDIRLSDS
jgi:hypothetical protein